jgi:hypothetical protein
MSHDCAYFVQLIGLTKAETQIKEKLYDNEPQSHMTAGSTEVADGAR